MPNGFHGSRARWERIEDALSDIDPLLREFADSHGMSLHSSDKAWPSRALKWSDDLNRSLQIYLKSEDPTKFAVGVHAFKDESDRRHWKSETLRVGLRTSDLRAEIGTLLDEGRVLAQSWTSSDLEVDPLDSV